jgi:antitoxin ParD1/3/4
MNISVSLTPELVDLIKAKVQSGRYTSTSEVVREALRLLERADRQEVERLKILRRAWKEGIESGDAGELDVDELRAAAKRQLSIPKKK